MKLYVADIAYAKENEARLRKLRMQGNMIAMYADYNRQGLMRHFRTLANYYIADHGEFAFSGCYTLFNERSAYTEKALTVLDENHVRYRFAYPYANACGGLDVKYESDPSLSNDMHTYALAFDSAEQKEKTETQLAPYAEIRMEDNMHYLVFRDSDPKKALKAVMEHENIREEQLVYLSFQSSCIDLQ